MYERAKIAVVIPAFNEERWIAETVRTMPAFVDLIVVVDDASSDATSERARAVGDERLVVLRQPHNRGVGAAIVAGYRYAMERADVLAVMAGDGQMHPDDLGRVVAPVAEGAADYVKGERLSHADVARLMPAHRRIGTQVLAKLTSLAAGIDPIQDSQCGYTAIASSAARALDLAALWPGYGYPNDLIGALARAGMRIVEVPVRPAYRGEASGLGSRHLAAIAYLLLRVAIRRRKA